MTLKVLTKQTIELAGLDLGSSAAKLVCLKKGPKGYTLTAACHELLPAVDDPAASEDYIAAVRKCLRAAGAQGRQVVCGVSGPEVVVRAFKFGPLPEQALEQAVMMEARQVCPFDVNQSAVDFQLVQAPDTSGGKHNKVQPRHGVMTAATERIIRERTACIEKAGGQTLMMDVNALALINGLNELTGEPLPRTAAVIDIGAAHTNVILYGQDGLPFARDIAVAGTHVISRIAGKTGISQQDIVNILSGNKTHPERNQTLLAMNDAIRPLVGAINETLRFYSLQEKDAAVERIYLCGGFVLLETFMEFLSDAMPVPVTILNPFTHMQRSGSFDPAVLRNGPMFAVAAGLAMRTLS